MLKSLFHWKVIINLLLAAAIFTGLVWLTFRWLEFHTNHGKEMAVPNVVNMSVQKAIEVLDDQGLEYEVDSFRYDPKFRPYQVLQIFPSAGSHVKDGRTIVLKVNPKTWAPVTMPDILDRYKFTAFRQLERLGLKVGDTLFEPSIEKDAVIKMMLNGNVLKPGSKVPMFSSIDLVIGSGPKRNVIVPNLVGRTVAEAKAIISQNYFEIGLVEHEDGGNNDNDIVYFQDPESGAVRDQGMQIDLWASKKTPAEMQSKINELSNIYRVRMNVPSTSSTDFSEETSQESVPPAPKPQTYTPKVAADKPAEKPKISSSDSKPSVSSSNSKPVEEKPAQKKVVVE